LLLTSFLKIKELLNMRRPRHSYPSHPYPILLSCSPSYLSSPAPVPPEALRLTPFEASILRQLHQGARVLFDMKRGRALIYAFRRGIESIAELTLRTLAKFVECGWIYMSGREGRLVHFTLHGALPLLTPQDD
jgi:hypothetical protein